MKIIKFGGSSLANAERIKAVVSIILSERQPLHVVFSAMQGVTNLLLDAAEKAAIGNKDYHKNESALREIHLSSIDALFKEKGLITEKILNYFDELKEFLHGIELIQECSPRSKDLIMSFGERMSCLLISSYLQELDQNVLFVDARDIIKTDSHYNNAAVDFKASNKLIHKKLHAFRGISVITGFIASDSKGITTTIGRNGSDYTASIIGAALNATEIEIWTDVDGVLSADPRIVQHAFVIPELSIEEAQELAYFGAKVIHPYSLVPVIEKNIPVHIKNTLNPPAPGSIIKKISSKTSNHPITGIASIESVSIINIEGSGMVGLPGIASKIFGSLARAGINIIMISQASSEHSICMVCRTSQIKEAEAALSADLKEEILSKKIQKIGINNNLEIIAVIGEKMRGTPGLSGKLFSALGNSNINVLAIAQGSSERNISLVIKAEDSREAINTIHNTFLMP